MKWDFEPRILVGGRVQLEPLHDNLFDEVCTALIPDPDGWYTRMFGLDNPTAYKKVFGDSDGYRRKKTGMGFAIRDSETSQIAGISFFLKMDSENRHLEIGTTNIAPKFRKTHINTATKLVMLKVAFENLECIRVSFRVDEENVGSRTAIERIGAKYGGLLRNERILPDGRIRNYLFYSIVNSEWPAVQERLTQMQAKTL
jgi:RimJ/RimL family protein N-acetyltransferase